MSAVLQDYRDDSHIEHLRVPPHAIDAEQAVLGGLMLAPETLSSVEDWLAPTDFYRRDHADIYTGILALGGSTPPKPFDAVTLGEWFQAQAKDIESWYLVELATTTPSAANIVAYAEIVRDKATLRRGIEVGTRLVSDCFQPGGRETSLILSEANHALTQIGGDPKGGGLVKASGSLKAWYEDFQERHASGAKVTGLPYPWKAVNDVTHGLQAGELTIIAARPSMGKSIMGLNLATFSALRGVNTAFFSLEMTQQQIHRRNIASLSNIPHEWLLAPNEGEDYWGAVTSSLKALKGASLLVDDMAGLRTEQFVARARRAHRQKPVGLIVLDHLHDMEFPGKRDMRHEVGAAVAAGKGLAKEFNCPVVMLAQLNRKLEDRTNKRPVMSDLRESGEIEQKADVVWFLYREDYYQRLATNYVPRNDVELILGKGRDLKVGAPITLRAEFEYMAMRDWEGQLPMRAEPTQQSKRGMK